MTLWCPVKARAGIKVAGSPEPSGQTASEEQADVGTDAARDTRVWTVPNVLSAARLAGVPLFLWLVLGPEADGWALVVAPSGQ